MVFLTMSPTMVEALQKVERFAGYNVEQDGDAEVVVGEKKPLSALGTTRHEEALESGENEAQIPEKKLMESTDSSLQNPKLGKPISHSQVIELSKQLKAKGITPNRLDVLLRGSKVYIPPPQPKTEPTSEYKALMARLRRDEEERSYDRMTNPPPPTETFSQRFPASSAAHAFGSNFQPTRSPDPFADSDEITYADVNRQMALILNVALSILACAGAIWVAARWWNTPARLALSMGGSILVGIAEVVVYSGYIRRVGESIGKEKAVKEVKEVINTWIIGGDESESNRSSSTLIQPKNVSEDSTTRKRTAPDKGTKS